MFPSEIVVVPTVFAMVAAVMITRMRIKHREHMASLQRVVSSSTSDERLARLEGAVDTIAMEVERIGEGQRFMTRLMSERTVGLAEGSGPTLGNTAREESK